MVRTARRITRRVALQSLGGMVATLYLPWVSRPPGGRLQVTSEGRVIGFLTDENGQPLSTAFPYVPCEAGAWMYRFMAHLMPAGWDGTL